MGEKSDRKGKAKRHGKGRGKEPVSEMLEQIVRRGRGSCGLTAAELLCFLLLRLDGLIVVRTAEGKVGMLVARKEVNFVEDIRHIDTERAKTNGELALLLL
jgi:hypothetical protein